MAAQHPANEQRVLDILGVLDKLGVFPDAEGGWDAVPAGSGKGEGEQARRRGRWEMEKRLEGSMAPSEVLLVEGGREVAMTELAGSARPRTPSKS